MLWTVIYSPFILHGIWSHKDGIIKGIVIAIRDFFLTGSYTHLWYLNSLIISVGLICLLLRNGFGIWKILVLSCVLFLVGLFGQTYFGLILPLKNYETLWGALKHVHSFIGTTRNAFFEGMFFVSLGAVFAWDEEKMTRGYNTIVLPIGAILLFFVEGIVIKEVGHPLEWNTYLFSGVTVFCIFRYIIDPRKMWSVSDAWCKWFRNIAAIVYLCHLWVRTFVDIILKMVASAFLDNFRYLIVCVISIVLGATMLALSQKEKFRFLKVFYS